jgi:predicted nucleic acid-binding protein
MAYLFDTNIFLEIFLDQNNKDRAKKLIANNLQDLNISDFSLHSIGIILLKEKKSEIFNKFLEDISAHATILSLSLAMYHELSNIANKFNLDFDDAYQTLIAKENNLGILTMDTDFKKLKSFVKVKFI